MTISKSRINRCVVIVSEACQRTDFENVETAIRADNFIFNMYQHHTTDNYVNSTHDPITGQPQGLMIDALEIGPVILQRDRV